MLSSKAVADGGVSYFIDHVVTARVSKYACGASCGVLYDPANQEHFKRSSQVFRIAGGPLRLPNFFDIILPKVLVVVLPLPCEAHWTRKDTRVLEKTEFCRSYFRSAATKSDFGSLIDSILCYKGASRQPQWTDEDAGAPEQLLP